MINEDKVDNIKNLLVFITPLLFLIAPFLIIFLYGFILRLIMFPVRFFLEKLY